MQYDSIHGFWKKQVSATEKELAVDGRRVFCLQEKHPDSIDWSQYGVDIVIECTGRFKKFSDWENPFQRGKKVIVSAPAEHADFTLVYGVNQQMYDKDRHRFISNASCTTNCLAPVIKF